MSKKNKNQQQDIPAPAPEQPAPAPARLQEARPPVPRAMIWTFWGAVAAALVAARALDAALPAVPERVIERWIMLAFAAFLAFFLYKIR